MGEEVDTNLPENKVTDIKDLYGTLPFELTEGQKLFLESFTKGSGHYSMLGDGGVGKTTLMTLLKQFYGDEIIFCGSTGVSAQQMPDNIGNGTAHKVLSLAFGESTDLDIKKPRRPCQKLLGSSDLVKIIVIDEAYALDSDHLHVALERIKRFNKATSKRRKRNIRLLLVGDPLQRLPIASNDRKGELEERYGHYLMFKSRLWKEARIKSIVLTEVKRQGDSKEDKIFKECLKVFRYGEESRYEGALKWINQRVNYNYDKSKLLLAPVNKTVDEANERALNFNTESKMTYRSVVSGDYKIKDCPADPTIVLARGLEVMTLTNDEEGRWANGLLGRCESISSEGVFVFFYNTNKTEFVPIHEFTEEETYIEKGVEGITPDVQKKKVIGTCHQLPIKPASAFTFVRCQGKTFDKAGVIDIGDKWLYTNRNMGDFGSSFLFIALSRFTTINNVELARPIEKEHIKVCRDSVNWWNEQLEIQNNNKSQDL